VAQTNSERIQWPMSRSTERHYVLEVGGCGNGGLSFFVISTSGQCSKPIGACIDWLVKRFAIWPASVTDEARISERGGTFCTRRALTINKGDAVGLNCAW